MTDVPPMESSPQLALAAAALAFAAAVGLYVGVRTLLVWMRTRGVAELAIGLNVLSASVGGVLLGLLISSPAVSESSFAFGLFVTMMVALVIHPLALSIGTWRIFAPRSRYPAFIVAASVVAMGAYLWIGFDPQFDQTTRTLFYECTRLALFSWTAFECFRYRAMLWRRVRIGLVEPIMAHRIGLWGIASVGQIVSSALPLVRYQTGWISQSASIYVAAAFGLLGALAIAFAFFPPAAYARWVEARYTANAS